MNVTCPNCATLYRVDPAKVPEAGVRARCAVCSAVFGVNRENRADPGVVRGNVGTESRRQETVAAPVPAPPPPAPPPAPPPPAPSQEPPKTYASPPPAAPATASAAGSPAPAASPPAAPMTPAVPVAPSRPVSPAGAMPRPVMPPSPAVAPGGPPRPAAPARPQTPPPSPTPPPQSAPRPSAPPPSPARRPANPFLSQDPTLKARRLARALVSDIVVYHPAKRQEGIRDGNLKQLFQEEIKKSWEEYTDQIGKDLAESTGFFREALNEILAGGRQVF